MTITRKILVASLAGLLPLTAVGWFAVHRARVAFADEVMVGLGRIADLERDRVRQAIMANDERLAAIADEPSALALATQAWIDKPDTDVAKAVDDELGRLVKAADSKLRAASVYDLEGHFIADTRSAADQPVRAIPAPLMAAGRQAPTIGRAFRTLDQRDRRYQEARPIRVGNRVIAVLVAECDLGPLVDPLASEQGMGHTAEAHLVQHKDDGSAEVISELRFERNASFRKSIPASNVEAPAILALQGEDREVESLRDYRGEEVVAAFRTIDGTGWGLIVKVDHSEAFRTADELATTLRLAALGAGGALIALSVLLARSIIRRIRRVTEGAEAISRGDLSGRTGDSSRDELGRLSRAFDRMAHNLATEFSQRERAEALLEHQARHDALTGLPNRMPAYERLSDALSPSARALARAGGDSTPTLGLLFCDLDSFKSVNDELGHSAGDELLRQVAARLRAVVGDTHTVARFGGDEFVLVCEALESPDDIDRLATELQDALAAPFVVHGHDVVITMSVGSVVASPNDDVTPETLVRDADAAMYRAKELGRNRHVPLDADIRLRASTRLTAVMNLRRAIDEGGLEVWYQPIVDMRSGRMRGVEALVRWPNGSGGASLPGGFVGLAEEAGLSLALDRFVLDTAVAQLRAWADDHRIADISLAVNVSGAMVSDPELVANVTEAIARNRIPPGRLTVEVTEVAFRGDDDGAARALEILRAAGVKVAIDDFGTGYSSLDRLRRLPVTSLKIDQTFVRDLDVDPSARAIAGSIMRLGATLGLEVVAEGVERAGQYDALVALGCVACQGFYFSQARRGHEIPELAGRVLVPIGVAPAPT